VLSFGAYAAIFLPSGSIFKPSAPIRHPRCTDRRTESRRLTSKYCIVPAFSIDFSLTVQSAVRKYRSTGCTVYHSTCTSTVPVPVHPGTDVHFCTGVLMNLLVFSTDRVVSTNTNYHSYLCTEYCPILISICSNTPILISICPVLEFRLIGSQV
jgi:hypothetical protein